MLAPDPAITFYTITLTLAEITGPNSKRLARRAVLKTLQGREAWEVFEAVCEAVAESEKGPATPREVDVTGPEG